MYDDIVDVREARREIERIDAVALSEDETRALLDKRIEETREE
ncbi:hypothetical protein [Actinospica durhamensis]|nr:hypothetical protein [Actinospica durhamensis]